MSLLGAIANSVDLARFASAVAPPQANGSPLSKPVLQFTQLPVTLNSSTYKNPRSDSNPNGDMRSLFAFRQLVDPVPAFQQFYSPRASSIESIYGQVLKGASVIPGSTFTARVVADAQKSFQEQYFSEMDGTPGQWRPVYAVPEDWYDASQDDRYQELAIDASGQSGDNGPFTILGGHDSLQLSVGGDTGSRSALGQQTKIRSIRMKYLLVQFRRPWLNSLLFDSGGWYLAQQPQGFCSSGRTSDNTGVLPLLPVGMLLAKDVKVDADWSAADGAVVSSALSSKKPVFLGPLPLQSEASSLNVIAFVSSLVPYSPKESDLRSGSVLVKNDGAFVSRFSVKWQHDGQFTTERSGNFPVLSAKSISIPPDARSVSLEIEIMTFPAPAETWKTVARYDFETGVHKCYQLSGATWGPALKEISCAE